MGYIYHLLYPLSLTDFLIHNQQALQKKKKSIVKL